MTDDNRTPVGRRAVVLAFSAVLALAALTACESVAPRETTATAPVGAARPARVPAEAPRFEVDSDASEIRLLVAREGPLAVLGHNHVMVAPVHGALYAGESAAASGFDLEIRVREFDVDPSAAREQEGPDFAAAVPDAARKGTRDNLLGSDVLDAARFPTIRIESVALVGPRWNPDVTARITLRGTTRDVDFPSAVVQSADEITVVAAVTLRQSDFGITPFSILGGGLRVRDAIRVRAHIVARRVP